MICTICDGGDYYIIQDFQGFFVVHFNAHKPVLMQTFTRTLAEH